MPTWQRSAIEWVISSTKVLLLLSMVLLWFRTFYQLVSFSLFTYFDGWEHLRTETARMKMFWFLVDLHIYFSLSLSLPSPLSDKSYWTYEGSLTTPPLYESVTWLVLKNPIQVTEGQVGKFRELCFHEESERPSDGSDVPVVANFRPVQPIHERIVSFIAWSMKVVQVRYLLARKLSKYQSFAKYEVDFMTTGANHSRKESITRLMIS